MRFPTIIGLIVLLLLISFGVGFLIFNQQSLRQNQSLLSPRDIKVVNITDSQAAVTWITNQNSTGQVLYGEGNLSQTASDERGNKKFYTHYVTLQGLRENTTYSFKVKSDDLISPDNAPLEFKTSSQKSSSDALILNSKQPISAAVLADSQKGATDALVFLQIKEASPIATYTAENGVFVLPLKELRKDDLQSFYNLTSPEEAELIIKTNNKKSVVKINVPLGQSNLPSLLLGQDVDLTEYLASPSAQIPKLAFDDINPELTSKYDLNNDKKINSLDLGLVLDNFGKRSFDEKVDLNSDGRIDEEDVNIIKGHLQ